MDRQTIEKWMDEKYKFWQTSHPSLREMPTDYWQVHKIAELPKRLQYLKIVSKYAKNPAATNIVDVGIAGGMFPFLLKKLGMNVNGLEWQGVGTQEELEKKHPGINVHACYYEKEKWPLEDNSTDIVTHLDLIEHVHPPLQFMFQEIMRVLKPGGILIMATPNFASLRKRLSLLRGHYPLGQLDLFFNSDPFVEHIREFTQDEISQLLKWSGFEILSANCINHIYHYRYAQATTLRKKAILQAYKLITLLKNDLQDTVVVVGKKPN